jgi:hypothetical protein
LSPRQPIYQPDARLGCDGYRAGDLTRGRAVKLPSGYRAGSTARRAGKDIEDSLTSLDELASSLGVGHSRPR